MQLRYGLTLNEYETVEGENKYYCLELKQGDRLIGTYNIPIYEQSEPSFFDKIEKLEEDIETILKNLKELK